MQKRKLIPLSTMLLCSLCLGACSCNKPSDTNVIATVNGKSIVTENVYNYALYDSNVAGYVYKLLEKALIESSITVSDSMRAVVENEVTAFVNKVKADAQLNETDYKEQLKTALEAEGVESLEELKAQKIYNRQKEAAKTIFLTRNQEAYAQAYVSSSYLYHVGDITLSVSSNSSSATDFYSLTISSDEAKAIHNSILELVEGEQYYNVAMAYSTGDSKSSGGEKGIVSLKDSSLTNEQRYALIGYSSMIEGKKDELYEGLNLKESDPDAEIDYLPVLDSFYDRGLESIPFSYIANLKGNYETTECYNDDKDTVYTSSKVYYRNILFNSLLNTRTPKFITLTSEEVEEYGAQNRAISATDLGVDVLVPNEEDGGYKTDSSQEAKYVLVNEEGNPYVVYRDNQGLHIMTIHMTPFAEGYEKYFSDEVDSTDSTLIYIEQGDNYEDRLKEIEAFAENYITKGKGSDLLDYAVFEYFLNRTTENGNFKIIDNDVKRLIEQYIKSSQNLSDMEFKNLMDLSHKEYANSLWYKKNVINKEIPLLSCLKKDSKGNNMCTYTYGKGFEYFSADTQEGGNA